MRSPASETRRKTQNQTQNSDPQPPVAGDPYRPATRRSRRRRSVPARRPSRRRGSRPSRRPVSQIGPSLFPTFPCPTVVSPTTPLPNAIRSENKPRRLVNRGYQYHYKEQQGWQADCYNTDCEASITVIEDALIGGYRSRDALLSPLNGRMFMLVGAGGAGRALAFGAKSRGARVSTRLLYVSEGYVAETVEVLRML